MRSHIDAPFRTGSVVRNVQLLSSYRLRESSHLQATSTEYVFQVPPHLQIVSGFGLRASSVKVDHKPRAVGHETPESSLFKTSDEYATVMHDDLPSLTQNAVKSDDVRVQLSFNGDGDVVHALGILREQHFLHGDIKPANLLVNDDNHLVLADFGLARDFGRPWGPLPWKQFQRAFDVKHPDHAAFRSLGLDGWDVTRRRVGTIRCHHLRDADWLADWYLAPVVVPLTFDEQKDTLVNDDARDLLRKMLEVDPVKRVTIEEIKEHTYFQSIDWKEIVARVPIMSDHTATHSPDMKQKPAYIPYAPPYKADEDLYSWFEWVSPALSAQRSTAAPRIMTAMMRQIILSQTRSSALATTMNIPHPVSPSLLKKLWRVAKRVRIRTARVRPDSPRMDMLN
ncbi:hypothetical protein EVJ58_g3303 [Rhodofomes roseus]|uniref:non-specific serine/threonine protein kinase n=1 Tax=Rhodofomes roseus TaxID=34475 RepID=A0A4Y9YLP8_9APHY|nr:hypothetical protein EVJ58_g3303 [Rhodofomes roseus]